MQIKPGSKVFLIHSKEIGYVKSVDGDGYCQVLVDGEEIPVALESLEIFSAVKDSQRKMASNYSANKQFQPIEKKLFDTLNSGLFLIVIPNRDPNLGLLSYGIALYNDTNHWITFEFQAKNSKQRFDKYSGLLKAGHYLQFDSLPATFFSYTPIFSGVFWESTTQGNENETPWESKVNGKKLVNTVSLTEFQVPVNQFLILNTFKQKTATDLKDYTKSNLKPKRQSAGFIDTDQPVLDPHDVWQKAEFPTVIDLHIETLFPDTWKSIKKNEYLQHQLDELEEYLNKAFMYRIDTFFIIHGHGKDVLRKRVHQRLKGDPNVKSFSDKYNPKFGNGATQVMVAKN